MALFKRKTRATALEPLVGALPAPRIGRFRPRRITHHHKEALR